jgi:hypothetical protein
MEFRIDNLKMMRETLCIAQIAINESPVHWSASHAKRLQSLIDQIDKYLPLGPNGKDGEYIPQRNMVTGEPIRREFEPRHVCFDMSCSCNRM